MDIFWNCTIKDKIFANVHVQIYTWTFLSLQVKLQQSHTAFSWSSLRFSRPSLFSAASSFLIDFSKCFRRARRNGLGNQGLISQTSLSFFWEIKKIIYRYVRYILYRLEIGLVILSQSCVICGPNTDPEINHCIFTSTTDTDWHGPTTSLENTQPTTFDILKTKFYVGTPQLLRSWMSRITYWHCWLFSITSIKVQSSMTNVLFQNFYCTHGSQGWGGRGWGLYNETYSELVVDFGSKKGLRYNFKLSRSQ